MGLGVGAVVKNEFIDLLDWVVYHKIVGVEAFTIADDRSFDGTLELLESLAKVLPVSVIRGFDRRRKPQLNAYKSVLESFRGDVCLLIDADEYLYSPMSDRPADLLFEMFEDENVSAVGLNWQLIGSDDSWTSQYGAPFRNQGTASDTKFPPNSHIKTAVRKSRIRRMVIHHAEFGSGKYLLADGSDHLKLGPFSHKVFHEPLRLLHFGSNGSFENFLLRRAWRQDIAAPKLAPGAKVTQNFYQGGNPTGESFTLKQSFMNHFEDEWIRVVKDLTDKTLLLHEFDVRLKDEPLKATQGVTLSIESSSFLSGDVRVESMVKGEVFDSALVHLDQGFGEFSLNISRDQETEIRVQGSLSGRLVLSKKGDSIVEDQKFVELTFRLARAERLLLQEKLRNAELEKSSTNVQTQDSKKSKSKAAKKN